MVPPNLIRPHRLAINKHFDYTCTGATLLFAQLLKQNILFKLQ